MRYDWTGVSDPLLPETAGSLDALRSVCDLEHDLLSVYCFNNLTWNHASHRGLLPPFSTYHAPTSINTGSSTDNGGNGIAGRSAPSR
jgi:hypothetical protein